jgi:peptide-methionine (S)-S-oxide reductase
MTTETAVFGGGCFWCTEAVFQQLKGVVSVEPGYAGGTTGKPTYESVSSGTSGHAEVVRVVFDPTQISYRDLLTVFFASHDPTTPNQQGNDVGPQYRSLVLFTTPEQGDTARRFIQELEDSAIEGGAIVTQVSPLEDFYLAEPEHQQFYERNPNQAYCQLVINPKLEKVKRDFARLLAR